jgi:hypothetical protein
MTIFRKIESLEKTFLKIENESPQVGDLFFVEGEFFLLGENHEYISVDFVFSVESESVGI